MLKYFLLALLPLLSLHANDNPGLFFTGPLLAPDGNTVTPGHLNWEPYLFVTTKTGEYDSNWKSQNTPNMIRIQPQLSLTIGLSKRFDIEITPQLIHNRQQGEHSTNVGDLPVSLGFQALHDEKGGFMPDLRITLDERFPLGKYQKLDPRKLGTDRTGTGSFITGLGFNFQKLFYLKNNKFLRARLTTSYLVPAPVHVKGFNTYGGGFGTTGKVFFLDTYGSRFSLLNIHSRSIRFLQSISNSFLRTKLDSVRQFKSEVQHS